VQVSNGIAETNKNRFLEKGERLEVFKTEVVEGIMPRNTVLS